MSAHKTILVTGSTDGLGRRVVEQAGGTVRFFEADFAYLGDVHRLADAVHVECSHLDALSIMPESRSPMDRAEKARMAMNDIRNQLPRDLPTDGTLVALAQSGRWRESFAHCDRRFSSSERYRLRRCDAQARLPGLSRLWAKQGRTDHVHDRPGREAGRKKDHRQFPPPRHSHGYDYGAAGRHHAEHIC